MEMSDTAGLGIYLQAEVYTMIYKAFSLLYLARHFWLADCTLPRCQEAGLLNKGTFCEFLGRTNLNRLPLLFPLMFCSRF